MLCLCPALCPVTVCCCVPVVFDTGRCHLPHAHQFGTAPSRGRQRAELIPTEWMYIVPLVLFLMMSGAQDQSGGGAGGGAGNGGGR
ncbi:hypothetical protein AMECASPLE_035368 [Ameca splendens]|uniref:Secreted protein n=1 Tax=Ameca splendens TaxID=208324 RepID=A0ABV0XKI5_9TELE